MADFEVGELTLRLFRPALKAVRLKGMWPPLELYSASELTLGDIGVFGLGLLGHFKLLIC